MKMFHIVDMNIFEVWVIAIRPHLKGRIYAQNIMILYSEYCSANYAFKTASYGKCFYTDCLRLIEMINFDIKNVSIGVRMKKLEPK